MRKLIRYKELGPLYGIWYCRTHLRRMYTPGNKWYCGFPAPTSPTVGRVGWWSDLIEAWLASRPNRELSPLLEE
jgi:predicted DNA-binding transcriptional regulator AlpA